MQAVDQTPSVIQYPSVDTPADPLTPIISDLTSLSGQYSLLMRAENRLDKQTKAIERGVKASLGHAKDADVTLTDDDFQPSYFIIKGHRDSLRKERNAWKKHIEDKAKELAEIWAWVEAIPGAGAHGLGMIVGEAGDLSSYSGPAKLWKRMGLAVEPDGRAQRRIKGTNELKKLEAIAAGYSSRRRTVMHLIGISLEMMNKHGVGDPAEYRQLYLDKKKSYAAREVGCGRGKCTKTQCTPGHIRMMALRVMEKRYLRDLWRAWRDWKKSKGGDV